MNNGRFKHGIYISQKPSRCSVVINHVFKTYRKKTIFNDVNLVAHSGQICAILGAIKSGKSMLLSCLVGGAKIDKGHIWVLGGQPGTKSSKTFTKNIGYMPQKFCLYQTMTFLELLAYFGQLYSINYQFILWRINYYNELFTLPPANAIIRNLSFSEKRIVSFLIAVFHRPRLIVLDEPTVGLDVFKRKQIWKYLYHVIRTWKPTLIIATNTTEEAFLATEIAYLKNGQIIFKKEVKELQQMNPNKSINVIVDDLYNIIMSNVDFDEWNNSNQTEIPADKKLNLYKRIKPRSTIWKLKTITIQNIKFLTKNIWMFILICVIPTLQVIFYCKNYGEHPNLMFIAVYNQETVDCVNNQCEHIRNCVYFSCNFINSFSTNNIETKYYDSELLARDSFITGLTLGYIKVPKNYTKAIIKSITESTLDETYDVLEKSSICIEIDMLKFEFGKLLKQKLMNVHRLHLISIYNHYNMSNKYAEIPLKIHNKYNNEQLTENTASGIISW
ncbi:ABC transporter-like,P-loop containing nucleoside triphosphate hydrolase [Cinara cedri]|uniref:ABC transporter-like,P-loop containing nucleoside triphosphate hydrolase n=1 Tax=Cinara cedri TaxID=506608 RepID=A0A5E4MNE5_9HEMI|nr:ABC transporter-like,P-loop containing nucleoside triphosphate hydrolase [Cinara cedri]